MDTLVDTLTQKLDAQEMIRANGEAESRQMDFLKNQVGEYMGCLDRMQQLCGELGSIQSKIDNLALPDNAINEKAINELKDQFTELTKTTNEQFSEFARSTNEKFSELTKATNEKFSELSDSTGKQLKDMQGELVDKCASEDQMHKEGVRLFKNFQASLWNELEPTNESITNSKKEILAKVSGIKPLVIISMILSAISIALQVLSLLHII